LDVREIQQAMNAHPFVPFTVRMADGRGFEVRQPDFIARSPSGRSVTVYDDAGIHVLDVRLVAELQLPEQSSTDE
jgi:hypothetical protein